MREVEKERKREGKNKRERKKIDASIEREAHGKERRGGSSQKERGELSKEKDRRPMRHRAGDDVVVVSRPSLTKSSQQIPVRPRSPVWTKSSSFLLRTSSRSSFFFFYIRFCHQHSEIHLRLDPETDGRFEEEGGCSISHGNG